MPSQWVGAGPRPARGQPLAAHLIRHGFAVPPSPLEGEGKGDRKGRPYGENRAGSIGSTNSGAKAGPHQKQILRTKGPCGPGKNRTQALLILRAGNDALTTNSASPVKGVRGKRPMDLGGAQAEP